MERLTLENISPYLPYGLKGNYLLSDVVPTHKDELRDKLLTADNVDFFIKYATPILRPTDLTKPIIVEGKEIIPIVELAKISFPVNNWKLNGLLAVNENGFHFFYNKGFIYVHGVRDYSVDNQPALFKKLYEWKFDIDGLIEKGLAIDVNTLETNPYNS